ncbi:gamma-glutamyltransferase family protein [Nakamurella sp.]|uniref:gamma-glutamyltransferase family protein n=1 Tax=Nakamurella sp. TaxID=1869182 RepID=UPI003B3A055F
MQTDGTVSGDRGMVSSVDARATAAGVDALAAGGSAADAAIATNAVLAVTAQHLCGLGGDLFALVHPANGGGTPDALVAVGAAGSGTDPQQLRAQGHDRLPRRGDIRTVTVPGCVDGWLALHERYGRLPLADLLAPAQRFATDGFAASAPMAAATSRIAGLAGADDYHRPGGLRPGDRVTRPLVGRTLAAIVDGGRDGFYAGAFGEGLVALGDGLFSPDDLVRPHARWARPIGRPAWDHTIWTAPPPSQGYLVPAAAWIADGLPLPDDPDDPAWPHLLVEAARWAGHDRPAVLHEHADGEALADPARLAGYRSAIEVDRRTAPQAPAAAGGTTYLCSVDADGLGVSLINSNAAGWGAHLVVPGTGVFLQNRGLGFSLEPGHPAEYGPGRRPPHTLAPALVTGPDGALRAVLGTMGGDSQPQIVLQLLARLLAAGQSPGRAVGAPRWSLGTGGFDTWSGDPDEDLVSLERGAPDGWAAGLRRRGHTVRADADLVGHAHAIVRSPGGRLTGAADPRAVVGLAAGR